MSPAKKIDIYSRRPIRRQFLKNQLAIRRRKISITLSCLILAGIGSWFSLRSQSGLKDINAQAHQSATALPKTKTRNKTTQSANIPALSQLPSQLSPQKALQAVVEAHTELQLGISYRNITTGDTLSIQGDQVFTAASTTKLITAILYLQQLEQGKYSLSDSLGDYSSEYQLEQLINQSNNDSWAFFNDALGFPAQETYAHSLGLASFSTKTNSLSPNDMTTLLYQLYTGKLLTKEHTDLILSYMKDTNEEGYIPAALPASTTVYHKTGLLDDNVHDGAIVDDGTHTYVLTIFSNGKGYLDYDARANVFSEIITALNQSLNASH